jgi:Trk K+ transport system NAD-binding subunit
MGLITTVGLITIALSTFMIIHSSWLYERFAPWLGPFERRKAHREMSVESADIRPADIIVLGLGRYGGGIVRHLLLRNRRVMGVDFDPEALARWRAEGLPVLYGDASDPDLLEHVPLDGVTWVVSTAPDIETSRGLLHHLRQRGFKGRIAVACRTADDGESLRPDGADILLRPFADAAEQAADAITAAADKLGAIAHAGPALREARLGSSSRWAGHRLVEVPLREDFGATVLAVSRGGRNFFSPGADFQLFPGDRLYLTGDPASLDRAVHYLSLVDPRAQQEGGEPFDVEEVHVGRMPGWTGQTLAELALPTKMGLTVLAMGRGRNQFAAPDPHRPLGKDDRLLLAGNEESLKKLRSVGSATVASSDP